MVRQISARLAQEGIDITDVFARRADEGQTFVMVMELAVPPGVDALALQRELEQLGQRRRPVRLVAARGHLLARPTIPRPAVVRCRSMTTVAPAGAE